MPTKIGFCKRNIKHKIVPDSFRCFALQQAEQQVGSVLRVDGIVQRPVNATRSLFHPLQHLAAVGILGKNTVVAREEKYQYQENDVAHVVVVFTISPAALDFATR